MVLQVNGGKKIPRSSRVIIVSSPPKGMCYVKNLYVDPKTKKLVVTYDDEPKK